jgi:maltokinase
MTTAGPDDLAEFLRNQRWFAGKDRPFEVTGVEVVATIRTSPLTELWLLHVDEQGSSVDYHLVAEQLPRPLTRLNHVLVGRRDASYIYDGLHDREITDDWLALINGERAVEGLVGHRVGQEPLPEGGPSLVMTAEQSNTSLVYGDSIVLKVFRRPHVGMHPDVEIHSALARVGCPHVARAYGWIDAPAGTFAFAQEFLADGVEGWDLAKSSVRDLMIEGDLHADEVGGDFAAEAERLGEVTAEVHQALREALPTDSWGADDLVARAGRLHEHLRTAVVAAPELETYAKALGDTYDDLAELTVQVPVQRVHGDLHLGQTMRVTSGWKLLDFEGEPARSVAERRALDSPLRDVAGMLRSFEYAAHQLHSDGHAPAQAAYRAGEWARRNRTAFCEGYAAVSGRDPREDEVLIRAFEADKAVYELVYETRMRPEWAPIPLAAIERLAG